MIRFGMHASLWVTAWNREGAELACKEAQAAGLEVIEIPLLEPEKVDVKHSLELFRKHNIKPTASLGLPAAVEASQHPARATAFLTKALDVAHQLGCNALSGVTYSTLGYRSGSPPTGQEYDNVVRALKPIARKAGELGMMLGLEPCNRYETHLLNTCAQTMKLLGQIDEKACMVHLDTYHCNIEEKSIDAALKTGKGRVKYFHLSESDRGLPGSGSVDWTSCFRALKANKFSGDLVIESFVNMMPQLAAALSVWRPVAKDRHEILKIGVPFLKNLAAANGL